MHETQDTTFSRVNETNEPGAWSSAVGDGILKAFQSYPSIQADNAKNSTNSLQNLVQIQSYHQSNSSRIKDSTNERRTRASPRYSSSIARPLPTLTLPSEITANPPDDPTPSSTFEPTVTLKRPRPARNVRNHPADLQLRPPRPDQSCCRQAVCKTMRSASAKPSDHEQCLFDLCFSRVQHVFGWERQGPRGSVVGSLGYGEWGMKNDNGTVR